MFLRNRSLKMYYLTLFNSISKTLNSQLLLRKLDKITKKSVNFLLKFIKTIKNTKKFGSFFHELIVRLSDVKTEQNNVAVLHNIFLALAADKALFFGGRHRAAGH